MAIKENIMITCKDATLLICKKQEGKLSIKERIRLKYHLLICKVCALFNLQSNLIHDHLQKLNKDGKFPETLHLEESKKADLQRLLDMESKK